MHQIVPFQFNFEKLITLWVVPTVQNSGFEFGEKNSVLENGHSKTRLQFCYDERQKHLDVSSPEIS